ncbi:MAG: phosphate acetyltransferase [Pseudomonadota bacterium]
MNFLDELYAKAGRTSTRIVLSEGEDLRIVQAAIQAQRDGLCDPILIGNSTKIGDQLRSLEAEPANLEIIDPTNFRYSENYADAFLEVRKHKGLTEEKATEAMRDPLYFAAMMVRQGDAGGTVGGAVNTTGDTLRAALQVIGPAPDVTTVSSFFLMVLDQDHHPKQGVFAFADCGLIVEPDANQLAQIAISTADSYQAITGIEPNVAMLSFSTMGSANHPNVDKVVEATAKVRDQRPDLRIEGELQFDAAFVPEVAAAKVPKSQSGGEANILVFPDLEAANIGYKIAQRIGKAKAIGPVLQGLAHPANDLSRGCDVEDIVHLIALTACQAIGVEKS